MAIVDSQVGYSTEPSNSYCNKFSAYWNAGTAACPGGETAEEWCADFAAWAWKEAGVQFNYGYGPGEINGGAVSFYEWGVANGEWHPATSGYVAAPGDVAVYGLSLGADPSAQHVAVVTGDAPGQSGPDVVNGDGDRTGFSRRGDRDRPAAGRSRTRQIHPRRLREPALNSARRGHAASGSAEKWDKGMYGLQKSSAGCDLPVRSRCLHPGQQHGRRWPSSNSSCVRRIRRSRVMSCFASSTQQMNSFRARGVISLQASRAAGLAMSALRRSSGSLCTAPPGTCRALMGLR